MSKNIQMPSKFLIDVYRLLNALEAYEIDSDTKMLCKSIEAQINDKIEAMERRKTFTEYKTAAQNENREQKRKEYLEKAGIHPDWITPNEVQI